MQTFQYDEEDEQIVAQRKWRVRPDGYVVATTPLDGERLLHRILMKPPTGMTVDHINRDPSDNRRENLRLASRQVQGFNRGLHRTNSTGFKGVSIHHGRYQASIRVNGTLEYLGRYDTAEEAHEAYLARRDEVIGNDDVPA